MVAGHLDQLGPRAGSGRRGDVADRLAERHDVVVGAVHAPDRYVERQLLLRVDVGVVRPGRVAEEGLHCAAAEPLLVGGDQVERYLDYCSEMLSLVGKTAALCAEESRDSLILETVSTIETLTVGLSRKIWQKISNLPPGEAVKKPGVLADEPASPGV